MSLVSEPAARQGFRAADLAFVGSGAALVVVCSLVAIPIGPAGAPITLQTFAVLLLGAVLGARRGALAVLLYLAVGFAGLPVFAEGTGGPATFAKVTLGYLLAFPIGAWLTGFVVERLGRRAAAGTAVRRPAPERPVLRRTATLGAAVLLGSVLGTLVIYALGVPVLSARLGMSLGEGLAINTAFLPVDLLKIALVTMVAPAVHRAFPDLLDRPAAVE